MDEMLEIDEFLEGGAPVLALRGEIDLSSTPALREALQRLEGAGQTVVVLDLSEVSFVDSTGLGVLVRSLKRLQEAGGELRLVVNRPNLLKVFEITGLSTVFPLFASREEACA